MLEASMGWKVLRRGLWGDNTPLIEVINKVKSFILGIKKEETFKILKGESN